LEKRIVGRVNASGYFDLRTSQVGGFQTIIDGAFAQTVNQLVASEAFKRAATGPILENGELVKPEAQTTLIYSPPASSPSTIPDAVGDVVTIFAGETLGSGFMISRDGLFLTNAHVVGDAHFVKVRWGDGVENLGEVVRVAKGRDVALVKSEARGRQPLSIASSAGRPGDTVFAIGAPLGLESTVTRGVYSALRNEGGYAFIQSDVTINPGNSGGPLLKEGASVIGIAMLRLQRGAAPTGLNFFIPIHDALQFLALSPSGLGQVHASEASTGPAQARDQIDAPRPAPVAQPQVEQCGVIHMDDGVKIVPCQPLRSAVH
jgi:S1-C subfamily serine protease